LNDGSVSNRGSVESLTRKWWFFLLFILLQFFPAYAERGYDPSRWGDFIGHTLEHAFAASIAWLYPVFKVVPILLVISLVVLENRVARWFDAYVGLSYVLFAFLGNVAVTEQHGLAIITGNFLAFLIVAAFWFWDIAAQKNDFTPQPRPLWRYWVVPLAVLAFWAPMRLPYAPTNPPDFTPIYLFINGAGLAYCMMTPVFLAILTLYYPRINVAILRVTSLEGILIGLINMYMNFFTDFSLYWWNGILHIPLVTISLYGFALSLQSSPREPAGNDENAARRPSILSTLQLI
jgi:hypothetical protein